MNIKVIGIDFDGVIVDSNRVKHDAFLEMFKGEKLFKEIEAYQRMNKALNRYVKLQHIGANILEVRQLDSFIQEKSELYGQFVRSGVLKVPFIPGALDFLERVRTKYPVHLVSATPIDDLNYLVKERDLNKFFVSVRGAPEAKSNHLRNILNESGLLPADMVYIGDALSDLTEATKAQVNFIGKYSDTDFPPGVEVYQNFHKIEERLLK